MNISLIIFLLSISYIGYTCYLAFKGNVPQWIEKRLYELRRDKSYEDISNKRWDTPIGALSKLFSLTILFSSFYILTYLIGYSKISQNGILFLAIPLTAIAVTYYMHQNFSRRLFYYRSLSEKKED